MVRHLALDILLQVTVASAMEDSESVAGFLGLQQRDVVVLVDVVSMKFH